MPRFAPAWVEQNLCLPGMNLRKKGQPMALLQMGAGNVNLIQMAGSL